MARTENSSKASSEGLRFRAHPSFSHQPQLLTDLQGWAEAYVNLEKVIGLPTYLPESAPVLQQDGNHDRIKEAAKRFRLCLGVGEAPISNLFEAVEALEIKVLRQPIASSDFFSISACSDEEGAFILINRGNEKGSISIERQIFTLAHEIGRLVLCRADYQQAVPNSETLEEKQEQAQIADYFASYLLMPHTTLYRAYEQLRDVRLLKQYFQVSYKAILYRLNELKLIDYQIEQKRIYRLYKAEYGQSLGATGELPPVLDPKNFPENRRFVQLIWQALSNSQISEMRAAELLGITLEKLGEIHQAETAYAI